MKLHSLALSVLDAARMWISEDKRVTLESATDYPNIHTNEGVTLVLAITAWARERFPVQVVVTPENDFDPELVEALAALAHDEQWTGWMQYMLPILDPSLSAGFDTMTADFQSPGGMAAFDIVTAARKNLDRWRGQMATPYADLPEAQRESDRAEARRILEVLRKRGIDV